MQCYSGTSGFSYKEWHGDFYPADLKPAERLSFYSKHLNAVEINNTFYRMPKRDVLEGWAAETPSTFRFVIKASRRITHQKRLLNAGEPMHFLLKNTAVLEDKLGAILFQLPPNMQCNADRLKQFLALCSRNTPIAMEFRHQSWFCEEIYELLSDHQIALVCSDQQPLVATTDWTYLRLRETHYEETSLQSWVDQVEQLQTKTCFAFFKHEASAAPDLAKLFHSKAAALKGRSFAQL